MTTRPDNERSLAPRGSLDIEPLKRGGLIIGAIGTPARRMDGMIQSHLDTVARIKGRGDGLPERPLYVFEPGSRLLINYSVRQNDDRAKDGLFADIVELDKDGKPRHGVGIVNPFVTNTGFVQVEIGDNPYGFAPSYTETRIDSDDPLQSVPTNVDTADLLAILSQSEISADEPLEDFLTRRKADRVKFRSRVREYQGTHYLRTSQSLTEDTNPDVHLIVTDRIDYSALSAASRKAGLFPIVINGDQVIKQVANAIAYGRKGGLDDTLNHLLKFSSDEKVKALLGGDSIGFVTLDLPPEEMGRRNVSLPKVEFPEGNRTIVGEISNNRRDVLFSRFQILANNSQSFARLIDFGYEPDSRPTVEKKGHGKYELAIDTGSELHIKAYTDWLRKVKLDFALTKYLRGLSQN